MHDENLSQRKKNVAMSFLGQWMESEILLLIKINQTQNDKPYAWSHRWNLDLKEDIST